MPRAARSLAVVAGLAIVAAGAAASPAAADPGFKAEPRELLFDFVPVGTTSAPKPVKMSNTGSSPNAITKLTLKGSAVNDFIISDDGCTGRTLAAGASCTINVSFRPTTGGTRVASIEVRDSTACPNWVTLGGSGQETEAPPTARASICTEPKPQPAAPAQPPVQDNSIVSEKRTCSSRRRFRIRLIPPRGTKIRRARVRVDGDRVRTKRIKGRVTAIVDMRGTTKRTTVVKVKIFASNGKTYNGVRTYRACSGKEPGGTPRH